jgi:hypothetical protein
MQILLHDNVIYWTHNEPRESYSVSVKGDTVHFASLRIDWTKQFVNVADNLLEIISTPVIWNVVHKWFRGELLIEDIQLCLELGSCSCI